MNKIFRKISIIWLFFLGISVFGFFPEKTMATQGLIIEWSIDGNNWQSLAGPIFNETNFLPDDGVSRLIRVRNYTSNTLKIGAKGEKLSNCLLFCLEDKLELKITQDANVLYQDSLANFLNEQEVELSEVLGNGGEAIYNFSVKFLPESSNDYQQKTVSFDLILGALGTESIGGEIMPGGSDGGGFYIPGLQIINEKASNISQNEVTITWQTNKPATSRVIYSAEGEAHTLQLDNPPNYGYMHSTPEDNNLVTSHSVVISGLNPGTTYYFRCVSHGSFAISLEKSFTTPGIKETFTTEEISQLKQPELREEQQFVFKGNTRSLTNESNVLGESIKEENSEENNNQKEVIPEINQKEASKEGLRKLLATISDFFDFKNLCWLFFILIIILIILSLLSFLKKKQKDKKQLILPFITLFLIILYYLFGCRYYFWLILAFLFLTIVWVILFFIHKKKLSANTMKTFN